VSHSPSELRRQNCHRARTSARIIEIFEFETSTINTGDDNEESYARFLISDNVSFDVLGEDSNGYIKTYE